VAEEVEGGLRAVVAAGGRDGFQVPHHRADHGAARAAGLDGAADQEQPGVEDGVRAPLLGVLEFTDQWTDRIVCELQRCVA
jgi:hypothetical protein